MDILVSHNYYQQPGGEDTVFASECAMLESFGHRVHRHVCHNDDLRGRNRLGMAVNTVWNREQEKRLRAVFRASGAQVAHFHNTFPIISPAAYYAARAEGVPVVQTLHNYRLSCLNAQFFRTGQTCEACLGKTIPWRGVLHGCYRQSRSTSAIVASTLAIHRLASTWSKKVSLYIALTEFAKQKFVEAGLPGDRIVVKPNFVFPDPGPGSGDGGYALFVGRLSEEKGIRTLIDGHRKLCGRLPLKIVGDGPMAAFVEEAARTSTALEWLGRRPAAEVYELLGRASLLIFPSTWYEGFPMVLVEAFARGTPILASDMGSMTSLVDHRRTGLRFRAGDSFALAEQAIWAMDHRSELRRMRYEARAEFEGKYTAERSYERLMDIYRKAISAN